MGFVIGAMLDALLTRETVDRSVAEYMVNPGPSGFTERVPGAAVFCALAALIMSEDGTADPRRIARSARSAFKTDEESYADFEVLARTAISLSGRLNPDLLAESLRARRTSFAAGRPDAESICDALAALAAGKRSSELAARIAIQMTPEEPRPASTTNSDPYLLLGVSAEASTEEIKAAYRRLAVFFHPDAAMGLSERQKESAAEAFMRIDGAYRTILGRRDPNTRKGA